MPACFRKCGGDEGICNHCCIKKKIETPTNIQTSLLRSLSFSALQLQLRALCVFLQDWCRQTETEEVRNPQQPSLPQSDARRCWTPPGSSALFSRPINSRRDVPFVWRVHKEWVEPRMLQAARSLLSPASLICSSAIFFFFLSLSLPASPPTTTFYFPVLLLSWKLKNESQRGKMKVSPSTPDNLKTDVCGPRCNTSWLGFPPGGGSALRFQGRKWQFCALIIAHGRVSCLSPSPLCVHNADRDKIKLDILLTGCSGGRKLRGWEEDQVSWGFFSWLKVAGREICAHKTIFNFKYSHFFFLFANWR